MMALLCGVTLLRAQDKLDQPIPLDPSVRTGKLNNGMTYYIRKNAKPENRVELRLALKAGSILEEGSQQGLAHFMEHMAFNGTKNFEKNELISYLQSAGVKFGAHLNAYTSFDETVYMLLLPTDSTEVLDKGFQILEDWAHQVSLNNEDIDNERGVVVEEWRTGLGASDRMRKEWFPVAYEGSRYVERFPIGKKEVLENFDYEVLRKFYKDWYRPDLMSVVVVGDIDVDAMEKKVKAQFGAIPEAKEKRERTKYTVPILDKNTVTVASDPESTFTQILLMHKREAKSNQTKADWRRSMVYDAFTGMLSSRLAELRESANPPFFGASTNYGRDLGDVDTYTAFAIVGPEGVEKGIRAILEEQERVRQHGFIQSELERYKKETLRSYEKAFKEKDKVESRRYASEYVSLFLDKVPAPGIEFEYEFMQKQMPTITLEEVNALVEELLKDEHRSLVVMATEKEGVELPTEDRLSALFAEVAKMKLEPYTEEEIANVMMEKKPKAGKVVEEETIDAVGVTRLKLSNGVEVVLKPTDFKNDEILVSAYSPGGHSLYNDEVYKSAKFATQVVTAAGVGQFSMSDLNKFMSDKQARMSPYISSLSEGFNGQCSPQDLETLLQMTHLYFTSPRKDKKAFEGMKMKNNMLYPNLMSNPSIYFSDEVNKITTQDHPRRGGFPQPGEMDQIDFELAHKVFAERFADAGDFTFYFVGNFEVEKIKPMLETYLGSLPSKGITEQWKDMGMRPPKGMVKKDIRKGTEPQSSVRLIFTGEAEYDSKESYLLSSLGELLSIKLIEQLREEKGGVYGVGARGSMQREPYGEFTFTVSFPCSPDNVETLIQATIAEIERVQKKGPEEADIEKVKKAQMRDHEVEIQENRFWLNHLSRSDRYDQDPTKVLKFDEKVEALTAKDLKKVAKKYLDTKAYIRAVLLPEE